MPLQLTPDIINAAIEGLSAQRQRIDSQLAELRAMLPARFDKSATPTEATLRKRSKFSDAARKKMAEAQKRRWAKIRGEAGPSDSTSPTPKRAKRKMSAAGRKAIQLAQRRRWALKRAEAKK